MTDPLHPFTAEQFEEMEKALERAKVAEAGIKKAQSAGIELEGMLEANRKSAAALQRILNTYRPR